MQTVQRNYRLISDDVQSCDASKNDGSTLENGISFSLSFYVVR